MAKQLFGRAFIAIDGNRISSIPGTGKISLGLPERTAKMSDTGFAGYTEAPKNAVVTCDINVDATTDLIAIGNTVDATITFECDTGQIYIVRNAAHAQDLELQSGDGKTTVMFIGDTAEQG